MSQQGKALGMSAIKRGYLYDSMGLRVDPNAYYDWEAQDGRLTALWRTGLMKPKNTQPLKKHTP